MTKPVISFIVLLFIRLTLVAASYNDSAFIETPVILNTATGDIFGTLTTPKAVNATSVALIIAGSGPTDRNGNNPMMKNESLRKLAYALANNNIASLRFDKRGIAESHLAVKSEADLRFEDYVNDAKGWLMFLKKDKRFSKVVVVGHSEGSLIGMIAAFHLADAYVSVAGAGKPADQLIKEQLSGQPQQIKDMCFPILDSLVAGKTVANVNPMLFSLFRPDIQPYMISWFYYDPQVEIQKLTIPVLIIQGTNDLQISVGDAKLLAKANAHAQLVLVKNMNHIFTVVPDDRNANIASYSNPSLPVSDELINSIATFINKR